MPLSTYVIVSNMHVLAGFVVLKVTQVSSFSLYHTMGIFSRQQIDDIFSQKID